MVLHVLGNNGPFPAPGGATSGYLVTGEGFRICLDLGSGTLQRLTGKMPPEDLDALFLTHWHYDHCADTLVLIYRLQALEKKIHVYAPADMTSPIREILRNAPQIILHDIAPGDTVHVGGAEVYVGRAVHPVMAIMLRICEASSGKTLVYTGDTNVMDGLEDFVSNADLLLADGLFPERLWSSGKPHLSARHCAQFAQSGHVRQLVITHFNPMLSESELQREAQAVFSQVQLSQIGAMYEI